MRTFLRVCIAALVFFAGGLLGSLAAGSLFWTRVVVCGALAVCILILLVVRLGRGT